MREAKFMSRRELKPFFQMIKEQYGTMPELFNNLGFVKGKERIYCITKDVDGVELKNIRINSIGLYIAEIKKEQFRLSIEGSQLVGPVATKNVCELTHEQLRKWLKGQDIKVEGEYTGFAILKYGNDYVGSGKYKEGYILNFVPKARRLIEMH